jgi:hypothetical protein
MQDSINSEVNTNTSPKNVSKILSVVKIFLNFVPIMNINNYVLTHLLINLIDTSVISFLQVQSASIY